MRSFFLLRHGETDWNRENRMQGQIQGVPLNETGIKQSRNAVAYLNHASVDLIVSSTLDRASATARIIGESLKVSVLYDDRLVERNWGIAEGLMFKELDYADSIAFSTIDGKQALVFDTLHPKGSETKEELVERASGAVFDLLSRHKEKRLLLVTHGAWLRALAYRLTGADQVFPNAIPYVAEEEATEWRIKSLV